MSNTIKPTIYRVGKFKLSLIAILVAILPISALMIAVLHTEYNATQLQGQTSQTGYDIGLQARQSQYDNIKNLINIERDNLVNILSSINRNTTEYDVLSKYDDAFFEEFNTMLDNNIEPELLTDFLFEQFGEYEYLLLSETFDNIANDFELNLDNLATRGKVWAKVACEISKSIFLGATAGAVVKVVVRGVLTPLITSFVASLSAAFSAAAPIVGTILGFIVGAAVGTLVYNAVKNTFEFYLNSIGGNDNYYKYWEFTLVEKSAWWIPVTTGFTLNITRLVAALIIKGL